MRFNFFKRNKQKSPQPHFKDSAVGKLSMQFIIGRPISAKRDYRKASEEMYGKNVIAYQCIRKIATAAAGVDIKLFRGAEKTRQQVEQHQLVNLLYKPNIMQCDDEFFRNLYSTFIIGGEVFIERVIVGGAIKELWIHSPDRVQVIPGDRGIPSAYRYKTATGQRDFPVDDLTGYCDMLHIKDFNPVDLVRAQSVADPVAFSIDQHNEASAWNYALLANGCRPSGALSVTATETNPSATLSEQQFNSLKKHINEAMAGGENAGKPIILEGGLEWKEFSLSPKDMDFVETVNTAARNIALAFGVPPILLGIPGDSTYNNLKEAKIAFYEDTVLPLIKYILSAINNWIIQLPQYRQFYFECDRSNIEALFTRMQEMRQSLVNVSWLTANEKRVMEGLDAIDGGDNLETAAPIDMPSLTGSKEDYISYLVKTGHRTSHAKEIADLIYD